MITFPDFAYSQVVGRISDDYVFFVFVMNVEKTARLPECSMSGANVRPRDNDRARLFRHLRKNSIGLSGIILEVWSRGRKNEKRKALSFVELKAKRKESECRASFSTLISFLCHNIICRLLLHNNVNSCYLFVI